MSYSWVILDTETTGITPPIYVVEVAAQRMVDMHPDGEPFSCLINHDIDIPDSASRIHGYTKELLDRDGLLPEEAYKNVSDYIGERHVVAYNLAYDWDDVLVKEWKGWELDRLAGVAFVH